MPRPPSEWRLSLPLDAHEASYLAASARIASLSFSFMDCMNIQVFGDFRRRLLPTPRRGARHARASGARPTMPTMHVPSRPALLRAPDDLVVARPDGLYCPAGDFYIDPWRPVDRAVITHAPRRPCARRPRPLPRAHATAQARCARGSAPTSRCRRWPTARRSTTTACASRCIRPATCSARRRCASNTAARSGSPRATTSPSPTAPARRSSRCAATPSSPSRPSACRSTAGRRRPSCSPRSTPGGARNARRGPRVGAAVLRLRQGAAHPARRRRVASARSSCTARSSR